MRVKKETDITFIERYEESDDYSNIKVKLNTGGKDYILDITCEPLELVLDKSLISIRVRDKKYVKEVK